MFEPDLPFSSPRAGLIEAIREARAAERDVFAALGPPALDLPSADGGWSAKDSLAHLSAWRQRQADNLAARREGRPDPRLPGVELDTINATIHAERAGWAWDRVVADAESTAESLIAEIAVASHDTLADPRTIGSIMGDGPEHDLAHLAGLAAGLAPEAGLESRVLELAERTASIVDHGEWPSRPAAFARYNLACFHALGGRFDVARSLLRRSLPEQEELRRLAPTDDDLIALRDEIVALAAG